MPIPTSEVKNSLEGAFDLFRFDGKGMEKFTLTFEGFFNSFFAALICIPIFVFRLTLEGVPENFGDVTFSTYAGVNALAYAINWIIYPLIAIVLCQIMGLGNRYVPFIIAWNWCTVWQALLITTLTLLMGILGGGATQAITLFAVLMVIAYQWFVARTALSTNHVNAAGFVIVDLATSMFIAGGIERFFQP